MLDVKLQDVKQTDEISGHEIAGHETAGHAEQSLVCRFWFLLDVKTFCKIRQSPFSRVAIFCASF